MFVDHIFRFHYAFDYFFLYAFDLYYFVFFLIIVVKTIKKEISI